MKHLLIVVIFLSGCSIMPQMQKRKLVTVFHLIEMSRFEDAKTIVEEMVSNETTAKWARTWYARGLLCQTAYQTGMAKNNKSFTSLYPDQLYVAWDSYLQALALNKDGRYEKLLTPKLIQLANEFQKVGETHFKAQKFAEALKAFETAMAVSQNPVLSITPDPRLIYNAGLAACEAGNFDAASAHLGGLHARKYSANTTQLLFRLLLDHGDSLSAIGVAQQGVEWFDYPENLVLPLGNILFHQGLTSMAVELLNQAIRHDTTRNVNFPLTRGIILQKSGRFPEAITSYQEALTIDPGRADILLNIATCWYNTGVEADEEARTLPSINRVHAKKEEAALAYQQALDWLQQATDACSGETAVHAGIQKLSLLLKIPVKERSILVPEAP